MRFNNQRILLTGGAGELGGRIAALLTAAGAKVTVLDRTAPSEPATNFHACDLATPEGLDEVCGWAATTDWDVLVNLAGLQYFGPIEQQPAAHLAATFMVNLVAPARLIQAVLPAMRQRKAGQIVNVGSVFGSINFAHFATYSASKAGLRGLSQALRRELTGAGVDVTYVAPRAVRTAFNSAKVLQFAAVTKTAMDDPDWAAAQIVRAIAQRRRDVYFGFPEALFVRLNALAPSLIDQALAAKDRQVAKLFA